VAFATGVTVQATGALDSLERATVKTRFDVRGAERPDDVVVVGIDAKSFDVLRKQWPFPRSLHGRAIRRLHAAGAREIVYDVQFTEPSSPREDLSLYRSIDAAGGAILATSESDEHGRTNVLGGDANLRRVHARAAASDLYNDDAGSINRFRREVGQLDTIPVVAAKRAGASALPPSAFDHGGALIDYRGPPGSVPTVSFADVVRGSFAPGVFRDRIVVVGASAPTLRDVHTTPVGGDEPMAGPEVQANAIWTALHGAPLHQPSTLISLLLVALLALVAPLVGLRLPALAAGLAVPIAGALFGVGAQLAFDAGLLVDVVAPLSALLVGGAGTIAWSQLAESRARRAVTRDNELL
jgi:CHASE2 domain-containing sensor protein